MRNWSTIATVLILIVVAVIEAAQQAISQSPDLAKHLPSWTIGGSLNYVPLALLIIAGVFWAIERWPSPSASRVSQKNEPTGTLPKAPPTTPPSPLPSWISPDDRKHLVAKLKGHQDQRKNGKLPLLKARVVYSPTENAGRLAQELGIILTEAGWIQVVPPSVRVPATPPLPNGIHITSSLSEPANLAALFASVAFNEIGLKHTRSQNANFRQYDFCFIFLEERGA